MEVNDDALRLVLERVGSHVSLISAAAVCKRWRRAVADDAFLRRFRSLHGPSVAGDYHNGSWHSSDNGGGGPVFVPSSPPVADARRFSLDFLPGGAWSFPWIILDSRGSLLLVMNRSGLGHAFPDIAVCEPLTRSFQIIPPPAENIDVGCSYLIDGHPDEAGGRIGMSNFRVLCMFQCDGVIRTAMLTAGSSWIEDISHAGPNFLSTNFLGRAGGTWYFCIKGKTLIELDSSTGEFTSTVFPAIEALDSYIEGRNIFVIEGRDGKPRIVTVFNNTMKVFARLDSGEWALAKSVLLSEATRGLPAYQPSFFHHGQEILTRGIGSVTLSPQFTDPWPYSIDLETMEAEQATGDMGLMVYRCKLPWPPALHACLD